LDLFANLSLNDDSDDSDIAEEDEAVPHTLSVAAVGPYVALLKASHQSSKDPDIELTSQAPDALPIPSAESEQPAEKKKRRKKNKKRNTNYNKPSKWADQCMYAELLEMTAEEPMWASGQDSLPKDLETKWVAVAPVPVGKRCLVVTHQSPGLGGMGTLFHSAVLEPSDRLEPPHCQSRTLPSVHASWVNLWSHVSHPLYLL